MLSFDEKLENNDAAEEKKEIVFNLNSNNAPDAPENATTNVVEEKIEKETKVNTKASSSKAFKLLASETPPPSLDRQDSKITNLNENDLKLNLLNDALSELEIANNSNDDSNNRKSNSQDDKLSTTSSSTNNNKTDLLTKSESLSTSIIVDKDNISCYLCIKVNTTRDFLTCPLDRRMKNRLRSEFWFQIYDNK